MLEVLILKYQPLHSALYDDLQYRPGNFSNHLRALKEMGFTSIKCSDLLKHVRYNHQLPEKSVLITFDNGYASDYEYGLPPLIENDFSATFFIAGDTVLKSSCKDPEFCIDFINLEQLRSLHSSGMELGLHGFTNNSFDDVFLVEVEQDIKTNLFFFQKFNIPYVPVLALPDDFKVSRFNRPGSISNLLVSLGIELAFQCVNKINKAASMKRPYLNRMEVSEDYPLQKLTRKINEARSKWFN